MTVPVALISPRTLEHCTRILPANIDLMATVQQFREQLASALLGEDKRLLKLTFKGAKVDDSAMLYRYAADDIAAPRFVASYKPKALANISPGQFFVKTLNGKTIALEPPQPDTGYGVLTVERCLWRTLVVPIRPHI